MSLPPARMNSRTAGVCSACLSAPRSRASASGGVPAGAYSPVQPYSVSEG